MSNTNKNHAIEAMRFLFICILCFNHCRPLMPVLGHAYLVVEFFFVLSGFLLYRSYTRHNATTIDYTLKRLKMFLVPCMITLLLMMFSNRKMYVYLSEFTPNGILETYYRYFPEFFFCQSIGLSSYRINSPMWYLSVLVVGGGILYSLLRNYKERAITLFLPVFCIMGYSYILQDGTQNLENWTSTPGFPITMVRGMADMGLGIITAYVFDAKKQIFCNRRLAFNVLGIVSMTGFCLMLFADGQQDYLALFFVPLIITTCFIPGNFFSRLFRSKAWSALGGISMYMFIIHMFVANIYYVINGNHFLQATPTYIISCIYLTLTMVLALLLKKSSRIIQKRLFRQQKK